jgi:hypothetical protein
MADGQKYPVRDRYSIAVGSTNAAVLDRKGSPHVLPLLTMTGISYLPAKNGKKKQAAILELTLCSPSF